MNSRKRLSRDTIAEINEAIALKEKLEKQKSTKDDDSDSDGAPPNNKGKLLLDDSCTPADITFSTDLKLLNKAREKSEEILDIYFMNRILESGRNPALIEGRPLKIFLPPQKQEVGKRKEAQSDTQTARFSGKKFKGNQAG